jgi:hypothetical protein
LEILASGEEFPQAGAANWTGRVILAGMMLQGRVALEKPINLNALWTKPLVADFSNKPQPVWPV